MGAYAPDGSRYVTVADEDSRGIYAPDGSIYVSETPSTSGSLYIEVVSGSIGGATSSVLMELGDYVLMETGDRVRLEG